MNHNDKYTGCLIGGAVGDALGYPVEFMSDLSIVSSFGKYGITEYSLNNGIAVFSDDTQMTLFTAVALLSADAQNGGSFDSDKYLKIMADSYSDWQITQQGNVCYADFHTWLANIKGLYSSRDPGATCIDAILNFGSGIYGSIEKPINNSKGCGGLMRVAPIGLWGNTRGLSSDEIALFAAKSAALTHGHELGYIPAAAFAHIISSLVSEKEISLSQAVKNALSCIERLFAESEERDYFINIMNYAIKLTTSGKNDIFCINSLGEGWVAEETLAIAVYCALKHSDSFERAIIASVNHSGDSDSTGSVTGNILGAFLGIDAIPQKFLTKLELDKLILTVADDLAQRDLNMIDCFKEKYITKSFSL